MRPLLCCLANNNNNNNQNHSLKSMYEEKRYARLRKKKEPHSIEMYTDDLINHLIMAEMRDRLTRDVWYAD